MLMTSQGAHGCTTNGIGAPRVHFGWFSDLKEHQKQEKIQPGVYSYALRLVFLAMWPEQWVSITLMYIQTVFLFLNSVPIEAWVPCSALPPCCEMKWSSCVGIKNIYWTLEHIYSTSKLSKIQMPCAMRSGKTYLYLLQNWSQLIEGSVLKMKQMII